jgi:hypothetical protein
LAHFVKRRNISLFHDSAFGRVPQSVNDGATPEDGAPVDRPGQAIPCWQGMTQLLDSSRICCLLC